MLVANRVDGDDGFLYQELELGVGIVDVRVVDALNKCFSCIGSLQTAGSLDLEDADIVDTSCFAQCVVVDKHVTECNAKAWRVDIEDIVLHWVLNNNEVLSAVESLCNFLLDL